MIETTSMNMPMTSRIANMISSRSSGASSIVATESTRLRVAPESARIWVKA